jgi:hypothetical protein
MWAKGLYDLSYCWLYPACSIKDGMKPCVYVCAFARYILD